MERKRLVKKATCPAPMHGCEKAEMGKWGEVEGDREVDGGGRCCCLARKGSG